MTGRSDNPFTYTPSYVKLVLAEKEEKYPFLTAEAIEDYIKTMTVADWIELGYVVVDPDRYQQLTMPKPAVKEKRHLDDWIVPFNAIASLNVLKLAYKCRWLILVAADAYMWWYTSTGVIQAAPTVYGVLTVMVDTVFTLLSVIAVATFANGITRRAREEGW